MQKVSRTEADYLRAHSPTAYIVITSKKKSKGKRKHYHVAETHAVLKLLNQFRRGEFKLGK